MENILQSTGDQVRASRDRQTGEPIAMLNLHKFKDKARYEDGRSTEPSGREAYQLYGQALQEIMGPRGVRVLYSGEVRGLLTFSWRVAHRWTILQGAPHNPTS